MEMIIDKIDYDNKTNLFKLKIEGDYILLNYEEFEMYELSIGDRVNFDKYKLLKDLSDKNEGMSYAIKYISSRLVSSHKIRSKLRKKALREEAIDLIIEELKDNSLIDDDLFLEYYIKDKREINLRSKKHIYYDLISMGFEADRVEDFLTEYKDSYEVEVASDLLMRKNYVKRKTRDQIYRYLMTKGFKYSTIEYVFKEMQIG